MTTPAGWYPDPAGDPALVRYWDGAAWTNETQPSPEAQPSPPPPAASPVPPAPTGGPAAQGMPVPPSPSGAGGHGGIRSELLDDRYSEVASGQRVIRQNPKMLKVTLGEPVLARQGAMVAFQGDVDFDHEGSGGVGKFMKKALTGEGVPLMRCTGTGELFLANNSDQVHILHLEGAGLTINGKNILAFETSLQWDVVRVQGAGMVSGGMFNTQISGHGWVAITTKGEPVVLKTDQPTFADPDAAVAWSSSLTTSLNRTIKAKAMIGRGSGEAFQLAFAGQGIVIVQPAESGVPPHSHA